MSATVRLGEMSTESVAALLRAPRTAVLLPVGSTEPHGPHLPLCTDALLSEVVCERAAVALREKGVSAVVAPSLPYGVTRYASEFAGAISLSPELLERVLVELLQQYRAQGFTRVAMVNNHLEPEHVECVQRAARAVEGAVFPNQLTRRWGRTLHEEFRRGDCHAGLYESSLVMAARPALVDDTIRVGLDAVPISLSDAIRKGLTRFRAMGSERGYFGRPAEATRDEGEAQYARLTEMVVTEVLESLEGAA